MDTQMLTEHTARMGATEIPRRVYLDRLRRAVRRLDVGFV
jgi:leucyl/phenylalanyl-tRNA---protein transferase